MVSETIVLGITIPAYAVVTVEGESLDDIRSWADNLEKGQLMEPIGSVVFEPDWEYWEDLRVVDRGLPTPTTSYPTIKLVPEGIK